MILAGTYYRSLDEKRRLSLPKRFRQAMDLDSKSIVFLTPGTSQCLQIHSASSLERLAEELGRRATVAESVQTFSRMFYAQAENCELDSQFRICLPNRLARWAELEKEIVLIGVGNCVEVWNPERWQSYFDQRRDEFDAIVYRAFDSSVETSGPRDQETQEPGKHVPR